MKPPREYTPDWTEMYPTDRDSDEDEQEYDDGDERYEEKRLEEEGSA